MMTLEWLRCAWSVQLEVQVLKEGLNQSFAHLSPHWQHPLAAHAPSVSSPPFRRVLVITPPSFILQPFAWLFETVFLPKSASPSSSYIYFEYGLCKRRHLEAVVITKRLTYTREEPARWQVQPMASTALKCSRQVMSNKGIQTCRRLLIHTSSGRRS